MGKGKKWLIGCLGTLGVCGIGTYAAVSPYVDFLGASRDLDKEIARAKALGNPMTSTELVPPKPADKDNAAVELKPILQTGEKNSKLSTAGAKALEAIGKNNFAEAETLLKPYQSVLATARKASSKTKFSLDRDWDTGVHLLFPEYAESKGLVKALAAQAELDFQKGNQSAGVANLSAGYKVGQFIGQEPILIGVLVEIANRAIASRAAESIAVRQRTNLAALSALESAVGNRPAPDFKNSLKGEMFMGTSTIRNLDKYGGVTEFMRSMANMGGVEESDIPPAPDPKTLRRDGVPKGVLEKAFLTRHLAIWNDALEQLQKTPEPREISGWLDKKVAEIEQKKALSFLLLRIMFPVFSQAGNAVVKCQATEGATRGFLKVLKFKASTGRYPNDLAEAGFNEMDPFSKAPYKFYRNGDLVRVYSVGPNGKDEEGLGTESRGSNSKPDQLDDIAVRTDRPVKNTKIPGA